MAAEIILYNALLNSTNITSIVEERISSDIRIQEEKIPAIWFDKGDTDYSYTLDSNIPATVKSNFFVTCYSETREESESLCDDIITALLDADFIIGAREPGYEPENDDYSTTIQASLLVVQ